MTFVRFTAADAKRYGITPPKMPPRKRAAVSKQMAARVMFQKLCEAHGLPAPVPEYRFHGSRKWCFDWAWPEKKVAVEIEGAVFTQGRHTRGVGFMKDMEKYNAAVLLDWRILRCTPEQVASGEVFGLLKRVM
jgi:hypothetical protein